MTSKEPNPDLSKGFFPSLPEEILVDPRPDRCKGCCDDETKQLISDDSRLSSTTTERIKDLTKTIKKTASSVGDKIADAIIPGSVGSSKGKSSKKSSGTTKTKSGKKIKQFTTLTIGSLDLGISGKDCPEHNKIEDEIYKRVELMPDVFFIQNRNEKHGRIFNTHYKNEFNANKTGQKFVSMYSNRILDSTSSQDSAEAIKDQAGIIIYKAPKFKVANIQFNSSSHISDIKEFLKKSTKESLDKKLKAYTEVPKEIKNQEKELKKLISSLMDAKEDKNEDLRKKINNQIIEKRKEIKEITDKLEAEIGLKHDKDIYNYIKNPKNNIGVIIGNFHDIIFENPKFRKNIINKIAKEVFDYVKQYTPTKSEVEHLFNNVISSEKVVNKEKVKELSVNGDQPQLTDSAKKYIEKYYEQIKKFFKDNNYAIKDNSLMYKQNIGIIASEFKNINLGKEENECYGGIAHNNPITITLKYAALTKKGEELGLQRSETRKTSSNKKTTHKEKQPLVQPRQVFPVLDKNTFIKFLFQLLDNKRTKINYCEEPIKVNIPNQLVDFIFQLLSKTVSLPQTLPVVQSNRKQETTVAPSDIPTEIPGFGGSVGTIKQAREEMMERLKSEEKETTNNNKKEQEQKGTIKTKKNKNQKKKVKQTKKITKTYNNNFMVFENIYKPGKEYFLAIYNEFRRKASFYSFDQLQYISPICVRILIENKQNIQIITNLDENNYVTNTEIIYKTGFTPETETGTGTKTEIIRKFIEYLQGKNVVIYNQNNKKKLIKSINWLPLGEPMKVDKSKHVKSEDKAMENHLNFEKLNRPPWYGGSIYLKNYENMINIANRLKAKINKKNKYKIIFKIYNIKDTGEYILILIYSNKYMLFHIQFTNDNKCSIKFIKGFNYDFEYERDKKGKEYNIIDASNIIQLVRTYLIEIATHIQFNPTETIDNEGKIVELESTTELNVGEEIVELNQNQKHMKYSLINDIKVVVLDFDKTISDKHTGGYPFDGEGYLINKLWETIFEKLIANGINIVINTRGIQTDVEKVMDTHFGGFEIEVYGATDENPIQKTGENQDDSDKRWAELKTTYIDNYIKEKKIEKNQVLFLDDTHENIQHAFKEGYVYSFYHTPKDATLLAKTIARILGIDIPQSDEYFSPTEAKSLKAITGTGTTVTITEDSDPGTVRDSDPDTEEKESESDSDSDPDTGTDTHESYTKDSDPGKESDSKTDTRTDPETETKTDPGKESDSGTDTGTDPGTGTGPEKESNSGTDTGTETTVTITKMTRPTLEPFS